MRPLESVGAGIISENCTALELLLQILVLQVALLLVDLFHEVGLCCPPRLVRSLLPVVYKFGLKQDICVHLGHKVVHLVIVGDLDPMVFQLSLEPVQLDCNVCDVRVRSVTPRHEEAGLDGQPFLGGDDVPRLELHNHRFYGLFLCLR